MEELGFPNLVNDVDYADTEFTVVENDPKTKQSNKSIVKAHSCFIDARCPQLFKQNIAKLKRGKKETSVELVPNSISPTTLQAVLHFVYTGAGCLLP